MHIIKLKNMKQIDVPINHRHRMSESDLNKIGITGPGAVVSGRLEFKTEMSVEEYRGWLNIVQVWNDNE